MLRDQVPELVHVVVVVTADRLHHIPRRARKVAVAAVKLIAFFVVEVKQVAVVVRLLKADLTRVGFAVAVEFDFA